MVGLNLDLTFEEYMYYARRSLTNFAMKEGQQMEKEWHIAKLMLLGFICAFPLSAFSAFRAS